MWWEAVEELLEWLDESRLAAVAAGAGMVGVDRHGLRVAGLRGDSKSGCATDKKTTGNQRKLCS